MSKMLVSVCIGLTITFLTGRSVAQTPSNTGVVESCDQLIAAHNEVSLASHLDQHTIASIARCRVQMLDNLQAARWYEQIADRTDCAPEYLLEYGQCLKSLKLYGKAKFYFQKYAQSDPTVGNQFMQSCDIAKMMMEANQMYAVTALMINSTATEFAPCVAPDQMIYNTWVASSPVTKLYVMQQGGSKAIEFNAGNNIPNGISHIRYSEDNAYVTYATGGFEPDERLIATTSSTKIYVAKVTTTDKWTESTLLPFCSDDYAVGYPALTNNGNDIYFASTMPGGKGGWDIYVSRRNGETWSKPENLGSTVNTPGNEISPYLIGNKFYFSSDRHVGIGGLDIYIATSNGTGFADIRNLGYPVNSPKDDLDFVWDVKNDCAYFASNRIGGVGLYDVYKATEQFNEIQVSVKNKENMKPLGDVAVTMVPGAPMTYFTNAQGSIMIPLPLSGECQIVLKKQGYQEQKVVLTNANNSQGYDVHLEPSVTNTVPSKIAEAPMEIKPEAKSLKSESPVMTGSSEAKSVQVAKPANQSKEMYFIQIAALARHSSMESYSDLRNYGDLILFDDGTYSKVRLGTFSTEAEAKLVLARVKADGYKDAFVVRQPVSSTTLSKQMSTTMNAYKVRLATYAKVGNFDPSHVMHLGEIESYRKDDLTIMLLAGYSTLAAAKEARDAAATQGFADAYVVMDNGGVLERVK